MYKLATVKNIKFISWDLDFGYRLEYLKQCIEKDYSVSLLIYSRIDTSTFRYRCYNVYETLQTSEQWKAVYFFEDELEHIQAFYRHVNIVVLVRTLYNNNIERLIEQVKILSIPLLFDIDDLIFDKSIFSEISIALNFKMNTIQSKYWSNYIEKINKSGDQADGFITTNAFLAKKLMETYKKDCLVIPNFLNQYQIEVSKKYNFLKQSFRNRLPFEIGYFSGSYTHFNDLMVALPSVINLIEERPDICLRIVGYMDLPKDLRKYIEIGKIKIYPFVDFLELQRLVAEVDVNIVPLVQNDFTNSKSELKYFESAIVNTITCATPTFTYKNCIQDRNNGFLCEEGDWYDTLKQVYSLNKYESAEIIESAYHTALSQYHGEKIMQTIENCYNHFDKQGNK